MIESLSIEKTIYFGGNLKCSHIKTRKNPLVSKFEYKSNPTILDLHVVSIISSMTQNTRLCPNNLGAVKKASTKVHRHFSVLGEGITDF